MINLLTKALTMIQMYWNCPIATLQAGLMAFSASIYLFGRIAYHKGA